VKVNLGELAISSSDFAHGQPIPKELVDAGTSPALSWDGVPEGTTSFALIVDDPDAPLINGFTHWVVYDIPADARGLAAAADSGYTAGVNDYGTGAYLPPGPPAGHGEHYYYFHLYAIGGDEPLPAGLTAAQLREAIDERVLAQARIVGVYQN